MTDLELTRVPGDRRLYALGDVGTLRLEGFASRTATAEARSESWRIARRGFWRRIIEAPDEAGIVAGGGVEQRRSRRPRPADRRRDSSGATACRIRPKPSRRAWPRG